MAEKENFTPKEIEVYKFLHEFRKFSQSGEVTITFHNFDFDKLKNIKYEAKLTGQTGTAGIEFYNRLLQIMFLMKSDNCG